MLQTNIGRACLVWFCCVSSSSSVNHVLKVSGTKISSLKENSVFLWHIDAQIWYICFRIPHFCAELLNWCHIQSMFLRPVSVDLKDSQCLGEGWAWLIWKAVCLWLMLKSLTNQTRVVLLWWVDSPSSVPIPPFWPNPSQSVPTVPIRSGRNWPGENGLKLRI